MAVDVRSSGRRGDVRSAGSWSFITANRCMGGETTVANVALLCRQHNQWEAERFFGGDSRAGVGRSFRFAWRRENAARA